MKVYITKYALTTGTVLCKISKKEPTMCLTGKAGAISKQWFHKPYWHETRQEAEAQFNDMKSQKIEALERQLENLKSLQFSVREE